MSAGHLALGVLAAAAAAALFETAVMLQALEARAVARRYGLRLSLIGRLARRRRWLLAMLVGALGWGLQIAALMLVSLAVVQPTLALGLFVLLGYGVAVLGEPVGRREVGGVLLIVAGVALMASSAPPRADETAGAARLALVIGGLAAVALLPYVHPRARAGGWLVVLSGGLGYALMGLCTKLATDALGGGRWAPAFLWAALTALAALVAVTSTTTAFQRRPATRVGPSILAFEVAVPVLAEPLLGGWAWGETRLGGALIALALVLAVGGVTRLASAPGVAGVHASRTVPPRAAARQSVPPARDVGCPQSRTGDGGDGFRGDATG